MLFKNHSLQITSRISGKQSIATRPASQWKKKLIWLGLYNCYFSHITTSYTWKLLQEI